MDEARAKELIQGFTTINSYMRRTWGKVFDLVEATLENETLEWEKKPLRDEMLENYMKACDENRLKNTRILLKGLRFVSKSGQPLRMIKRLEPDPALLDKGLPEKPSLIPEAGWGKSPQKAVLEVPFFDAKNTNRMYKPIDNGYTINRKGHRQ